MHSGKKLLAVSSLLLLAACGDGMQFDNVVRKFTTPEPAQPVAVAAPQETMLETVRFSLANDSDVAALAHIVAQDPPSAAELNCAPNDPLCSKAKALFDQAKIPSQWTGSDGSAAKIILSYRRVLPAVSAQ